MIETVKIQYIRFEVLEPYVEALGVKWCVDKAFKQIDQIFEPSDKFGMPSIMTDGVMLNGKIYDRNGNEILGSN